MLSSDESLLDRVAETKVRLEQPAVVERMGRQEGEQDRTDNLVKEFCCDEEAQKWGIKEV